MKIKLGNKSETRVFEIYYCVINCCNINPLLSSKEITSIYPWVTYLFIHLALDKKRPVITRQNNNWKAEIYSNNMDFALEKCNNMDFALEKCRFVLKFPS
jgi:hypothetical protein